MSNPIHGYRQMPVDAFAGIRQTTGLQPKSPIAETPETSSAGAVRRSVTTGLTPAEQQMIDRYFPESPVMAMRLYGPGRQAQTVRPTGVGSMLDLRG